MICLWAPNLRPPGPVSGSSSTKDSNNLRQYDTVACVCEWKGDKEGAGNKVNSWALKVFKYLWGNWGGGGWNARVMQEKYKDCSESACMCKSEASDIPTKFPSHSCHLSKPLTAASHSERIWQTVIVLAPVSECACERKRRAECVRLTPCPAVCKPPRRPRPPTHRYRRTPRRRPDRPPPCHRAWSGLPADAQSLGQKDGWRKSGCGIIQHTQKGDKRRVTPYQKV